MTFDMAANSPSLSSQGFAYDPLSSPTSIRLLKVLPKRDDCRIEIELWEERQAESEPYRCLSYTWGESSDTASVHVNGRSMEVGSNLFAFLVVATQRFPNEALWIDAISINQLDSTEKGHQVQRMGDVYKGAVEVLVWLGNDDCVAQLFDWTQEKSTIWHKLGYYMPKERIPKRLRGASEKLANNRYWTRAWIVQELAFARSIRLLCSLSESSPEMLRRCRSGALYYMVSANLLFLPISLGAVFLDMWIGGKRVMDPVLDFLVPMTQANPVNQRTSGFVDNLDIWTFDFASKQCQEPRDRIYSLLAIANATDFEVNYTESIYATFWRAAEYFNAYQEPSRLISLWEALELNGMEFLSASKLADGRQYQCSIAARPSGVVSHFGVSTCRRAHGFSRVFGAKLKSPVSEGDILLCAGIEGSGSPNEHFSSPHFVLRSDNTSGEDRFIIAMYLERLSDSRAICLQDAELWFSADGIETKIVSWKELMIRVEGLGDLHESTSGFAVKSSSSYILASIGLYKSGWRLTNDVLKKFDSTLEGVEVKVLPSEAGG